VARLDSAAASHLSGSWQRLWDSYNTRIEDESQAVRMHQSAISNEEFIAQFRDWLLQWKPTLAEIEHEVSYLSKLAEFMAPVPLAKVTKAVLQGFQLEERRRLQSHG
jgi:hypothetical protein